MEVTRSAIAGSEFLSKEYSYSGWKDLGRDPKNLENACLPEDSFGLKGPNSFYMWSSNFYQGRLLSRNLFLLWTGGGGGIFQGGKRKAVRGEEKKSETMQASGWLYRKFVAELAELSRHAGMENLKVGRLSPSARWVCGKEGGYELCTKSRGGGKNRDYRLASSRLHICETGNEHSWKSRGSVESKALCHSRIY